MMIFLSFSPLAYAFPGWNSINTIYYDPVQDDTANNFLSQAATILKSELESVSGTYTITSTKPSTGIFLINDSSHPKLAGKNDEGYAAAVIASNKVKLKRMTSL